MGIHIKNHDPGSGKHKTHFNRGRKNHTIKSGNHKVMIFGLGGLMGFTALSGMALSSIPGKVSATNNHTATASVTVRDTCIMEGIIDEGKEHTASVLNGSYTTDICETKLKTICNDAGGYSIYAIGYSNNQFGNTDMIGATTGLKIPTGADSGNVSNWSMKLSKDTTSYLPANLTIENGFDSYSAVPSTYTKVASYSSSTGVSVAEASTVKTTYAVRVARVQNADTYTGQVKYTMVHPRGESSTAITFDDAFQLAGKSRVSGTAYFAMQDMSAGICEKVTTPTNTTTFADTPETQLIDTRDNKVYWVAKLLNGKCWMTQNLDLDLSSSVALTSENNNLTVSGTAPYVTGYSKNAETGVISWTPSRSTIATGRDKTGTDGEINYGTNAGAWTNSDTSDYSVDPGKWYETSMYFSSSVCNDTVWSTGCNFLNSAKTNANNGTADGELLSTYFSTTPYDTNGEHGAIGNWYNWNAAVASSDTEGVEYGLNKNQANSICPKGWTLPNTVGTGSTPSTTTPGTWGNLNRLYNNGSTSSDNITTGNYTGLFNSPLYLVRGGFIYTNSSLTTLYNAGRLGFYWSSTAYSASDGYNLSFRSSLVNPANNRNRGDGFSVRCVVDDTMQSFSDTDAAMMAINETVQLRDTRDGNIYTVGKLADGNVWLLDNLRLGGDSAMTLTSADTNIASGTTFTLPASSTADFTNVTANYENAHINADSATTDATYRDDYTGTVGKIGVYYNYCAASAGTYCYPKDTSTDYGNASYDICPSGWHMPSGGTENGSYDYLYNTGYSANQTNFTNALRTPLSGVFYNRQAYDQGTYGYFWSSTRYNSNDMYRLYVNASNVNPQSNFGRYVGYSVRCIKN